MLHLKCLFTCSAVDGEFYASLDVPLTETEARILRTVHTTLNSSVVESGRRPDYSIGWHVLQWFFIRTAAFHESGAKDVWLRKDIFGSWIEEAPQPMYQQLRDDLAKFIGSHELMFSLDSHFPRMTFFGEISQWKLSAPIREDDRAFLDSLDYRQSPQWMILISAYMKRSMMPVVSDKTLSTRDSSPKRTKSKRRTPSSQHKPFEDLPEAFPLDE